MGCRCDLVEWLVPIMVGHDMTDSSAGEMSQALLKTHAGWNNRLSGPSLSIRCGTFKRLSRSPSVHKHNNQSETTCMIVIFITNLRLFSKTWFMTCSCSCPQICPVMKSLCLVFSTNTTKNAKVLRTEETFRKLAHSGHDVGSCWLCS